MYIPWGRKHKSQHPCNVFIVNQYWTSLLRVVLSTFDTCAHIVYIYPLETCLLRFTEPPPCQHMMIHSGAPWSMMVGLMFVPGEAEVNEHQLNVPVSQTLLGRSRLLLAVEGGMRMRMRMMMMMMIYISRYCCWYDTDTGRNLGLIGCILTEVKKFQSRHSIQLFFSRKKAGLISHTIHTCYI